MSTIKLHAGAELHNMSPEEFRGIVKAENTQLRSGLRAIKPSFIPRIMNGVAAGGVLTIGQQAPSGPFGPAQGQMWSIRRLVVSGLTAGATPDVVALYYDDSFTVAQWTFFGSLGGYQYKWGRGEITMQPGHVMIFRNVGAFAATGTVQISGQYDILPAEESGRLAVGS
jgi:hypothetical protein